MLRSIDRLWFLTWTTYGTWLPGDRRGFVSPVLDADGREVVHNTRATPYDAEMRNLEHRARTRLKCLPVYLDRSQAEQVLSQLRETALHRGWVLSAAAVMRNHVHVVVGVPGDPNPDALLPDFKSYASRALNRHFDRPERGTWWTESGSKRKIQGERSLLARIEYVRNQPSPLAMWIAQEFADRS